MTNAIRSAEESLQYFSCDCGGSLQHWAVSVADRSSTARVTTPEALNPTLLKVSHSWQDRLPHCFHSESHKRQNRVAWDRFFFDLSDYGYSRVQLRAIDDRSTSELQALHTLNLRHMRRQCLRVKDVVRALRLIANCPAEEQNEARRKRDQERQAAVASRQLDRQQKEQAEERERVKARAERVLALGLGGATPHPEVEKLDIRPRAGEQKN